MQGLRRGQGWAIGVAMATIGAWGSPLPGAIAQTPLAPPSAIAQAAGQNEAKPIATLPGNSLRLAFSPDGRLLATIPIGSESINPAPPSTVEIWDWRSGRRLHQLSGHSDLVMQTVFSPDGQTLATLDYRLEQRQLVVRLWDLTTGTLRRSITRTLMPLPMCSSDAVTAGCGRSVLVAGAFSPDGRTLYTGGVSGVIDSWDVASGRRVRSFSGPREIIRGLALSPDGRTLAISYWGGQLALFDPATGRIQRQWQSSGESIVLRWSRDSRQLVGLADTRLRDGGGRMVWQWDAATGEGRAIAPADRSSLWAASNDRWVATGHIDGTTNTPAAPISLIDRATGRTVRQIQPPSSYSFFELGDRSLAVATPQAVQIWAIDP